MNVYIRQIIREMMDNGEIKPQNQVYSIYENKQVGDFTYVMVRKSVSPKSERSPVERWTMTLKYLIKAFIGSPIRAFFVFSRILTNVRLI